MCDDPLDLSLSVSWDELLEEKVMAEVIKEKEETAQDNSQLQPVDTKEYRIQLNFH